MTRKNDIIDCHWPTLRTMLLMQWRKLSAKELNEAGPKRRRIAMLVQKKYGVAWQLVENYLFNIERSLPTTA